MSLQPPPKPDRRYLAGQVIADRYALVRKIGQGGMGVVWLAHSLTLDVDVAIKLISRSGHGRKAMVQRLAQEARAAARFGHPAIVRVFDFGQTDTGDPFLVMELLEGESLAEVLEREARLPAVRAVQTLLPIADALATAHDGGIVHRDLKPENIFLSRDNVGRVQPKLLDFGIVKMMDEEDIKITKVGVAVGSPEYMSPEQARGRSDVDWRGDVWALCVVLYELVAGQVPFTGDNYNAAMRAIIEETPRPTTELHAGDQQLWRILERGLQKKREDRWQSMWELGEALALWLYEHGVKEDICAASLRTSWLEAGFSGVKVEIVSHKPPPPKPTQAGLPVAVPALPPLGSPAGPDDARETEPAPAIVEDAGAHPALPAVLDASPAVRAPRRLVPVVAAGVLLLGALGLWIASQALGGGAAPKAAAGPASRALAPVGSPSSSGPEAVKPEAADTEAKLEPAATAGPSAAPPAPHAAGPAPSQATPPLHAPAHSKKPSAAPRAARHAPRHAHKKSGSGDLDFGF